MLSSFSHLLTRPHLFLASKPALLISALYFGTYVTANGIDTLVSTFNNATPETTTSGPLKFVGTTAINMSLCLYKDSQFVRLFGPPAPVAATAVRTVSIASYALFAFRDSLTIFAAFNLPPLIAPILPLSTEIEKHFSKASMAQFLAPAGIQLLSTPVHLLGLDLYNRPTRTGVSWRMRAKRITRDWLGGSVARMSRIVPAFGVGGVVNNGIRKRMMKSIEE